VIGPATAPVREPSVAGSFYPSGREHLASIVRDLLAASPPADDDAEPGTRGTLPAGLLVPHAGLVYSGAVAAAGWSRLSGGNRRTGVVPAVGATSPLRTADSSSMHGADETTVVILGTNHGAPWLRGVAAWADGSWRTPLGDVAIDDRLAGAIVGLGPPFFADRHAHAGEHSIEVQLPLLQSTAPEARIVPLAVAAGTGPAAIDAGHRLGQLLALRRARGERIVLAISSDMAHYPSAAACEQVTERLLPAILAVQPAGLAAREHALLGENIPGLVCGMCGIQPAVLGLAALRAMGALSADRLGAATSADASGPWNRTVGYLAVRFDLV
jgi:AmmeMemoRadiSam system protein B